MPRTPQRERGILGVNMIVLEHITKTFDENRPNAVHAVKDVSLHIRAGEIYGIIGYSGAGKSTLVRCINLLERPTSGTVTLDGVALTALKPNELRYARKKIGMIFQQFNLLAGRTVAQNIAMSLQYSGLPRSQIREKVKRLLEYVELSDKANAWPSQLSGGQKQRVAIARALANDPKVLLCDEATSALDPQTTQSILALLQRLNRELGITIVVITHEMAVIKKICHRVAVMENGEVVEENDVLSLFADPKKQITRDFLRTTSNLSGIYPLVEADAPITRLQPGELLLLMRYGKTEVSQPLISRMTKEFNLEINILFGDLEIIGSTPMGGTVVIFHGSPEAIAGALQFLKDEHISVEVIRDARSA